MGKNIYRLEDGRESAVGGVQCHVASPDGLKPLEVSSPSIPAPGGRIFHDAAACPPQAGESLRCGSGTVCETCGCSVGGFVLLSQTQQVL